MYALNVAITTLLSIYTHNTQCVHSFGDRERRKGQKPVRHFRLDNSNVYETFSGRFF